MNLLLLCCLAISSSVSLLAFWLVSREHSRFDALRTDSGSLPDSGHRHKWDSILSWIGICCFVLARKAALAGPWQGVTLCVTVASAVGPMARKLKERKRLEEVKAEWPVMLESMANASMAGVDLRNAFLVASRRTGGALREEVEKVNLRSSGGQPLSRALASIEKSVPPARRLRSMLVQAEVLGSPVSAVLTALAEESDEESRQDLEQRFGSLPVKLSAVTVVLLLPPVLIVSIVPHLLTFLKSRW